MAERVDERPRFGGSPEELAEALSPHVVAKVGSREMLTTTRETSGVHRFLGFAMILVDVRIPCSCYEIVIDTRRWGDAPDFGSYYNFVAGARTSHIHQYPCKLRKPMNT